MPLYEYQCPRCGATRDVRVALNELKTIMVVCHGPKCDTHMKRVIPKINVIFKWKERIMGKFMGFYRGMPPIEAADPFAAQDPIFSEPLVSADSFEAQDREATPTVLLHVQEGPLKGVSGALKFYSAGELFPFGPLVIKFKRLYLEAKVPTRKFPLDAGLDIYALDTVYIAARSQEVIRTGIALADAPDNCVVQIWSKSGLDARLGLHVGAGIVDPGYRGEILVLLKNMSDYPIGINKGDAIAQLVIVPCMRPDVVIVEEIETTDRGGRGGITNAI